MSSSGAAVTLGDGRRIFLRKRSLPAAPAPSASDMAPDFLSSMLAPREDSNPVVPATAQGAARPAPAAAPAAPGSDGALWTDKHAPTRFLDLLSDEKTNRGVLKAVKAWDGFVFRRDGPRPEKRLVLLAGPPGTGKTTLANIVLRQAGYEVVEVNGSDDRSPKALRDRVYGAMTSNTVFGENKPVAVIIDEVDGSDGRQAVQVLVDLCSAALPSDSADPEKASAAPGKASSGRRPRRGALAATRPLVCICNNPYEAHLRPLRPLAEVFHLDRCPPRRLIARLRSICTLERSGVGTQTLARLAERTNYDVRACLHSLQLASARRASTSKDATAAVEEQLSSGMKDEAQGVLDALQEVFWAERKGRRAREGRPSGLEAQRLVAALHERYLDPDLRVSDPALQRAQRSLSALCDADVLCAFSSAQAAASSGQVHAAVGAYAAAFCPRKVALSHRSMHRPRLPAPRLSWEMRSRRLRSSGVLEELRLAGGRAAPAAALRLEVVPLVCAMLDPKVKAAPFVALRPAEQARLLHAARAMRAAGLRLLGGEPGGRLDPPVDGLVLGERPAVAPELGSTELLTRLRREEVRGAPGAEGERGEKRPAEAPPEAGDPKRPRRAEKVLYKFQAGVTNAVRRALKVKTLVDDFGWRLGYVA